VRPFCAINVIPFIDIMLVLLAIVLTTATFIAQGKLEIDLPEASSKKAPLQEERLELAIDREERIYFDEQPVDIQGLATRLAGLSTNTPIVLRVDSQAHFGRFVAVVDLLKQQQLDRLTILTKETQ